MSVINVKVKNLRALGYNSLEDWLRDPNHVYIGRYCKFIKGARGSKWANPYSLTQYSRKESLELYEKWVQKTELIKELEGKILGCWCKPEACHGDILIKLLKES